MIGYLFSGQGSQKLHMGQDLRARYDVADKLYQEAQQQTGLDLSALSEAQLAQTQYAQLAIVVHSTAAFSAWQSDLDNQQKALPQGVFAGFSLGEYSALAASGVLGLSELLELVSFRAKAMQAATEAAPGAMVAVIGLDREKIDMILKETPYRDKVWAANDNAPGQLVIAGLEKETLACSEALKALGARRLVRLQVNGAFHTPLMQLAADQVQAFAKKLNFREPVLSFYSNTTAGKLASSPDWPSYLAKHMVSPVRFVDEVTALNAAGCTQFIEFGTGKVLTGLVRKISRGVALHQAETADDIAALSDTVL